ncbi:hypothetical protein WICMUC_005367 [Wickerhamomyces mucosus]|uniref:Nodulin-like domain-containing protein n=1 Tax=Wickerhamomyces mucosus TaxID=1378264 RepID=A0A9P8P885_9ASCO|nr:hypothetical protein WICMUC_005367 [Wickerhamomyces mucosus]
MPLDISKNGLFRPRIKALIAAFLIAMGSSTPYVYSIFAPQLIENSNLTPNDAAKLGLFLSLGGTIGGFPAGIIIDHIGPAAADRVGGFLAFTAFSTLHYGFVNKSGNLYLFMFALSLSSFASIISFYSTIKCATTNFPHHRGIAGAFPVSAYALGSLIYSSISVNFFTDNTAGLLRFISLFSSIICVSCSFYLHIITHIEPDIGSLESQPLIRKVSVSSQLLDVFNKKRKSFSSSLSYWGVGKAPSMESLVNEGPRPEAAGSSINSNPVVLYTAVEDTPVFVKEGTPLWSHEIVKTIFSRLFIKYYIILGTLQAVGQFYIYSVGFLVVTLVQSNSGSHDKIGSVQSLQVSIIAIASFLGRLSSGPISDFIRKKLKAQRLWCIVAGAVLMTIGQITIITINDSNLLIYPSLIIGFAFGFIFGTFPAIVADDFGTSKFTTFWGLMTTGASIILSQLNNYFASDLVSNSDEDGLCTLASSCYSDTFILTKYLCILIGSLVLVTIYMNHRIQLSIK